MAYDDPRRATFADFYAPVTLHRDGQGGYTACDGRFVVQRAAERRGDRLVPTWRVVDTQPEKTYALNIGPEGRHCHALYDVREQIQSAVMRPTEED